MTSQNEAAQLPPSVRAGEPRLRCSLERFHTLEWRDETPHGARVLDPKPREREEFAVVVLLPRRNQPSLASDADTIADVYIAGVAMI